MSSLGGSCRCGKRSRRRRTVSIVSSTERVVCESQTTFSGSFTTMLSTSSGPLTSVTWSGASPAVPSTSSWPSWPMSRISKSSRANRTASRCTLVTSGHVASIAWSPRSAARLHDRRRDTVRAEDDVRACRHLVDLVDEDRALLLERRDDVHVVHDLLAHVHRGAVVLEGLLDGHDGSVHTRAVSTGRGQQHPLVSDDRGILEPASSAGDPRHRQADGCVAHPSILGECAEHSMGDDRDERPGPVDVRRRADDRTPIDGGRAAHARRAVARRAPSRARSAAGSTGSAPPGSRARSPSGASPAATSTASSKTSTRTRRSASRSGRR